MRRGWPSVIGAMAEAMPCCCRSRPLWRKLLVGPRLALVRGQRHWQGDHAGLRAHFCAAGPLGTPGEVMGAAAHVAALARLAVPAVLPASCILGISSCPVPPLRPAIEL